MKISEFAFVVYPSTDRERSKIFYEGVLGLAPAMSLDIPGGFWVEYEMVRIHSPSGRNRF
jgi:catechol 2,3-dioxygenase-like lactoylglutathione lyase family enzyme